MNARCFRFAAALLALALCGAAQAQQEKGSRAPAAQGAADAAKAAPAVEYRPPARGAPRVRVGGSTRGIVRELNLAVVAPDHTGLASSEQPELYWYISQPVKSALEFTLIAADGVDPLVEKPIAPVAEAGIQRIRLADLGARLKSGEEYQWSISFVGDPAARSKDTVASGRVRVQPLAADVAASVGAAGPAAAYATYARAGYWYDALAALRAQLAQRPGDAALVEAQHSLLEQVGLTEIARFERRRLSGQ